MIRFFATPADIGDDSISLRPEDTAHIRSVRLRPCEQFTVCDGEGFDYICKLGDKSGAAQAQIIEKRPSCGEPYVRCDVYIALAKGDRLDYAVQKSVELGAYEIILFPSARCISAPTDISKKTTRLQRIALETAKQCGRGRIPHILASESIKDAVAQAAHADLPLFFYEEERTLSLKTALEEAAANAAPEKTDKHATINSVSIVTGPEGGFEPFEAELAQNAGMLSVSLGSRILRCETAPIAALSAIMFFLGEM